MLSLLLFSAFAAPQISVLYNVEKKVGVWMENQSGNSLYNPDHIYQADHGYVFNSNQGFLHKHYLGGYFYTTTLPQEAVPFKELSKQSISTPKGFRIEEKKRKRGSVFFLHKNDGSKSIIARGTKIIDSTLWFSAKRPKISKGFAKPADPFGWEKLNSQYTFDLPKDAKKLSVQEASKDDISIWSKEVQTFLPHVNITHGKWANLDNDPELEAIVCGIGVRFDSCFIYDREQNKWFGTLLKWNKKDPPMVFEKEGGTYILFRSHKKSRLMRVLFFTGHSYDTHLLHNRSKRKRK